MSFTIKRIIIRHRAYIAVWQKGRRGLFGLFRQQKGINKKEVERILNKKITKIEELPITVFRVTAVLVYFYDDFTRVGRLRLVVFTTNPNKFNTRVMRRLLILGDKMVRKNNVVVKLAKKSRPMAREEKVVDPDEFRRSRQPLDVVFGELAGFGLRQQKFRMNFK